MSITLDFDEQALATLPFGPGERRTVMQIELACRFYASGWLTLGMGARLAHLDYYAFGVALAERGIARQYGLTEAQRRPGSCSLSVTPRPCATSRCWQAWNFSVGDTAGSPASAVADELAALTHPPRCSASRPHSPTAGCGETGHKRLCPPLPFPSIRVRPPPSRSRANSKPMCC